jgi:hypothetical protein
MIQRKPQDPALDPLNVPLEEKRRRNAALLQAIREWRADASPDDEEANREFERRLDENREISGDYRRHYRKERGDKS